MKTFKTSTRKNIAPASPVKALTARKNGNGNGNGAHHVSNDNGLVITIPVGAPSPRQLIHPAPAKAPWQNPTQLERPAFLLNCPFSY
jgi:hypothetical protein